MATEYPAILVSCEPSTAGSCADPLSWTRLLAPVPIPDTDVPANSSTAIAAVGIVAVPVKVGEARGDLASSWLCTLVLIPATPFKSVALAVTATPPICRLVEAFIVAAAIVPVAVIAAAPTVPVKVGSAVGAAPVTSTTDIVPSASSPPAATKSANTLPYSFVIPHVIIQPSTLFTYVSLRDIKGTSHTRGSS